MTPTVEQFRVAAIANLAIWAQITDTAIGRRGPGVAAAGVAMILAQQAGRIENLPPLLQAPVRLLTLPGSLAIAEGKACCKACAKGEK